MAKETTARNPAVRNLASLMKTMRHPSIAASKTSKFADYRQQSSWPSNRDVIHASDIEIVITGTGIVRPGGPGRHEPAHAVRHWTRRPAALNLGAGDRADEAQVFAIEEEAPGRTAASSVSGGSAKSRTRSVRRKSRSSFCPSSSLSDLADMTHRV